VAFWLIGHIADPLLRKLAWKKLKGIFVSKFWPQLVYDDIFASDKNYYRATAANKPCPRLETDKSYDIVIVGGGLSGLATAKHLLNVGIKNIAIIERHFVGWGASGRNGGEILPGFTAPVTRMARRYGLEFTKSMWDLSTKGVADVVKTINELDIDCDLRPGYVLAMEPEGYNQKSVESELDILEKIGHAKTFKSSQQTCAMLGCKDGYYKAGLHYTDAFHFHPLKYLYGLKDYLLKQGVSIYEETPCIHFENENDGLNILTPKGNLRARKLVLCGDSYLGTLVPHLRRKYVLIRNAMIATEPLPDTDNILPSGVCVSENKGKLMYYRKTADNRLIIGGGDTIRPNNDPKDTRKHIVELCQNSIADIFPQIAGIPISYVWGGYIGITSNYLPYAGSKDGKIYYMGGYSGHGVNQTHIWSALIANAIKNENLKTASPIDRLSHLPMPGLGDYDNYLAQLGMLAESVMEKFD